jgi:hypothetical protein
MVLASEGRGMRQASIFAMVSFVFAASLAAARSRHEAVKLKPLKAGNGFKLTLKLVNHDGYALTAVGLVPRDKATTSLTRPQAINKSLGILRHQFAPVTGMARGETREVEFELTYGKDNDLKPGEKLSVISAWGSALTDTSPHVWGGVMANGTPDSHVELP